MIMLKNNILEKILLLVRQNLLAMMEKYLIKINTYAYLKTSLSKGNISTNQLEN